MSEQAKHTRAPWFVFGNGHCVGGPMTDPLPAEAKTAGVAMCSMNARLPEENTANALLIAASPDLLAACRAALPELRTMFNQLTGRQIDEEPGGSVKRAVDMVTAAIAKTTPNAEGPKATPPQTDTCKSCGKPIAFTGKFWEHTTCSVRHPAVPAIAKEEGRNA